MAGFTRIAAAMLLLATVNVEAGAGGRPRPEPQVPFDAPATAAAGATSITTVFTTDFESGLPAQFSAPGCQIEGVQGWAGLGPPGYPFGGNFLRYHQQTLSDTRLRLANLPPHSHLNLRFMLAVIDSWDGTELMQVLVDGTLVFSHWFQIATGDTTSYVPAPGARLSAGVNLGFSNGSYWSRDRAYDLSVEPSFLNLAHTADTVEVVWRISALSGPAAAQWQGGSDESWAIENVAVDVLSGVSGVGDLPDGFGIAALPSPVRSGSVRVSFSLPSAAPGTLELFDVAGRRVASREVGAPGRQTIELRPARALAPGLYLVRLAQEGRADVRSVVLLD